MVLQVAGLALLAGVGVQAEEALLQRHLQLLLVGVGVALRAGGKFFLQNFNLHRRREQNVPHKSEQPQHEDMKEARSSKLNRRYSFIYATATERLSKLLTANY